MSTDPTCNRDPTTDDEGDGLGSMWKFYRRRRYNVAILSFFGFTILQSQRGNLSVAVVAMTSNRSITMENGTTVYAQEFNWNSKLQGLLLSSFFYGYITTQIVGGWLAAKFGGKRVLGIGLTVSATITFFIPLLVKINVYVLMAARVVQGIFQSTAFPSNHAVWARWAPTNERSTLTSLALAGNFIGYAVTFVLSGVLVDRVGWDSVFYVFGVIGLFWCIVWWMVVKAGPEDDPRISPQELRYIQNSLGAGSRKLSSHPWREILTSVPVWAAVVAHMCDNWGYLTMVIELPAFVKDTLHYDLEDSGMLTMVPYLASSVAMPIAGRLADWLLTKKFLSTTKVRKLFCCGAMSMEMVFMFLVTYVRKTEAIVACLFISITISTFSFSSYCVNHLDIASHHASIVMGISNTAAALPGIISPIITGYIVQNHSPSEWRIVFYMACAIYIFGAVFYGIFGRAERQSWVDDEKHDMNEDNHSMKPMLPQSR